MSTIIDNLNALTVNVVNCKKNLLKNLNDKGITAVTSSNTLTELTNQIPNISQKVSLSGSQRWYDKLDRFDFSNVTDMSYMFYNCRNLSGVSLDTSNVTDMGAMFISCSNLSGVSLDTSKVTNMGNMFNSCSNLSGVSLDTSKVTNMSAMFYNCSKLSGVSLDTSNVTDMSRMFYYCSKLKTINITNFGKASGLTDAVDFSKTIWGQTSSSDTTDATAVQSIRDTLITNSFDRKTAGYSVLTIQLNSTTLGYLTGAEKSSITAKGYTLTV